MAMETTFCDFYIEERILGGHFIKLIRYLWWHDFPASSWDRMVLVLISNNYTEESDESGTLFLVFYDLKGSIYKNELTM